MSTNCLAASGVIEHTAGGVTYQCNMYDFVNGYSGTLTGSGINNLTYVLECALSLDWPM